MPKDSLVRLVEKGDRERAVPSRIEPDRLILPPRPPAQTRRICFDCRQRPTLAQFRDRWLADNPPPPASCMIGENGYVCSQRIASGQVCDTCVEHTKGIHLAGMTNAAPMTHCPLCNGLLIEVTV